MRCARDIYQGYCGGISVVFRRLSAFELSDRDRPSQFLSKRACVYFECLWMGTFTIIDMSQNEFLIKFCYQRKVIKAPATFLPESIDVAAEGALHLERTGFPQLAPTRCCR